MSGLSDQYFRGFWTSVLCAVGLLIGCAPDLDVDSMTRPDVKARGDWPPPSQFPLAQDLAVLFPRSPSLSIRADLALGDGSAFLPTSWLQSVGDAFQVTVVGDGFLSENSYGDWHIAAMRVVPCSPLQKLPSPEMKVICWPNVRFVWQPTQHNVMVRNRLRTDYSDDRAIHMLFDFFPPEIETEAASILESARAGQSVDEDRFIHLRDIAVEALLDEVFALRLTESLDYGALSYRGELTVSEAFSGQFIQRASAFISRNLLNRHVHTVTAFSLPSGRNPALINLWTFVAFEVREGFLRQRSLDVIDPTSGMLVGRLDGDETVAAAAADPRLAAQVDGSESGRVLANQIISSRDDIGRLRDRINDPEQTMVENTSCATCHNFNRILFDFHNLSYFESLDITISPRVIREVEYDIAWMRRWLDAESQSDGNAGLGDGSPTQPGEIVGDDLGTCDRPLTVGLGTHSVNSVGSASVEVGASETCRTATGPEFVVAFQPPQSLRVCASTVGSDVDTVLYVRAQRCSDGLEIACNDDAVGVHSTVSFEAKAGTPHFIFLDSYGDEVGGEIRLKLTAGSCP